MANIDPHCCKLVKPPAIRETSAGCAAEADDCTVNELPVAQVCVWEDTQYLQLLASVSFLRAAPNMSPGAHGPLLNCQVTAGAGLPRQLLDAYEELAGNTVLALLLVSSCYFN